MNQVLFLNNKRPMSASIRFKQFSRKSYSIFNSIHRVVSIGVLSTCVLFFAETKKIIAHPFVNLHILEKETDHFEFTDVNQDTLVNNSLEEIIVTSNRTSTSLKQTARQIFIIDERTIKSLPVQSVQDLLNYISGIDVQQRGGHGVQADISIRGGSFDQTAILLNGINLSNPQTGHFSLDIPINISDIKQIEIIYGPSSFIYGASAFAGGINIITNTEPTHKIYTKIEAGTHNLFNVEANIAIKIKNSHNQLSIGKSKSDGYIDNSDYKISNILWQTDLAIDKSQINIQLGYNDKKYGANTFYSAAYPNQYDKTNSYFASAKGNFGDKFKFIPTVYWSTHNDEFQLFRDGTPNTPIWYVGHNYHKTDVFGTNLNLQHKTKYGVTNLASEIRTEKIVSNVLGKEKKTSNKKYTHSDSRTNISYIAEHTLFVNKINITGGLLLNYNSSLDKHYQIYPSINISYWLTDNIKLYTSWNKAFRMPTFTDLYYTTATHIGNSKLREEKSQSSEIGMQYHHSLIETSLTAYYMQGKNLIDWIKENPDDKWESRNLTKINKLGFDVNISLFIHKLFYNLNNTILQLNYTHVYQNKDTDGLISNYVLNYLRDKFNICLTYSVTQNIGISYSLRWQKRMGTYLKYVNLKPTTEEPFRAFSISDIQFSYKLKSFKFAFNINNIFDQKYQDLGNVPQAGFWLISGISYTL